MRVDFILQRIIEILKEAKEAGITNILALRGDPPKGAPTWTRHSGGLDRAVDLVKLIRRYITPTLMPC